MEIESAYLALSDDLYESVSSSNRSSGTRPNKFLGLDSKWRELTKDERIVHVFVNRMRDQDISIHLYNAQAMKVRRYIAKEALKLDPWSSKDHWRKEKSPQEGNHGDFVPPKSWTAWPLSPEFVPRTGEQFGVERRADGWTLNRREILQQSLELEEILIALTLRLAKEKFQARDQMNQVAPEQPSHISMTIDSGEETDDVWQSNFSKPGREHQQETTGRKFQNKTREDAAKGLDVAPESGVFTELPFVSQDQLDVLPPQVMVDDKKSAALLRSTVRHNLTQLDELLMALHETRKACLYYGSERSQSESEIEGDGIKLSQRDKLNTTPSLPGTSSKSDVISHEQTTKQRAGSLRRTADFLVATSANRKTESGSNESSRGRKRKLHDPLEGGSQSEMLQRIVRSQKKPIPLRTSVAIGSKTTSPTKSPLEGPRKRGNSTHAREIRSKRLGLRDWSEIIGAAALVGLSPQVIARATQRCADLFGEGMEILSLADNSPLGEGMGRITQYLPDQKSENAASSRDRPDSEQCKVERTSSTRRLLRQRHSKAKSEEDSTDPEEFKALIVGLDTLYCPLKNCIRQKRAFTSKKHLTRHLRDVHDLKGSKLKNALSGGGDEMVGGVHIDGFLMEVVRRRGWRGSDGEPRQRATTGRYLKEKHLIGSDYSLLSSSHDD